MTRAISPLAPTPLSRPPSNGCRIGPHRYNLRVHVTAIVAAGGRGERLGSAQPKQMLVIGGRSILERSVQLLVAHPAVDEVVVALPPGLAAQPPAWLTRAAKKVTVVS